MATFIGFKGAKLQYKGPGFIANDDSLSPSYIVRNGDFIKSGQNIPDYAWPDIDIICESATTLEANGKPGPPLYIHPNIKFKQVFKLGQEETYELGVTPSQYSYFAININKEVALGPLLFTDLTKSLPQDKISEYLVAKNFYWEDETNQAIIPSGPFFNGDINDPKKYYIYSLGEQKIDFPTLYYDMTAYPSQEILDKKWMVDVTVINELSTDIRMTKGRDDQDHWVYENTPGKYDLLDNYDLVKEYDFASGATKSKKLYDGTVVYRIKESNFSSEYFYLEATVVPDLQPFLNGTIVDGPYTTFELFNKINIGQISPDSRITPYKNGIDSNNNGINHSPLAYPASIFKTLSSYIEFSDLMKGRQIYYSPLDMNVISNNYKIWGWDTKSNDDILVSPINSKNPLHWQPLSSYPQDVIDNINYCYKQPLLVGPHTAAEFLLLLQTQGNAVDITYTVTSNGRPRVETTTELTLVFSKDPGHIDIFKNDGEGIIGAVSGTGKERKVQISGITTGGLLQFHVENGFYVEKTIKNVQIFHNIANTPGLPAPNPFVRGDRFSLNSEIFDATQTSAQKFRISTNPAWSTFVYRIVPDLGPSTRPLSAIDEVREFFIGTQTESKTPEEIYSFGYYFSENSVFYENKYATSTAEYYVQRNGIIDLIPHNMDWFYSNYGLINGNPNIYSVSLTPSGPFIPISTVSFFNDYFLTYSDANKITYRRLPISHLYDFSNIPESPVGLALANRGLHFGMSLQEIFYAYPPDDYSHWFRIQVNTGSSLYDSTNDPIYMQESLEGSPTNSDMTNKILTWTSGRSQDSVNLLTINQKGATTKLTFLDELNSQETVKKALKYNGLHLKYFGNRWNPDVSPTNISRIIELYNLAVENQPDAIDYFTTSFYNLYSESGVSTYCVMLVSLGNPYALAVSKKGSLVLKILPWCKFEKTVMGSRYLCCYVRDDIIYAAAKNDPRVLYDITKYLLSFEKKDTVSANFKELSIKVRALYELNTSALTIIPNDIIYDLVTTQLRGDRVFSPLKKTITLQTDITGKVPAPHTTFFNAIRDDPVGFVEFYKSFYPNSTLYLRDPDGTGYKFKDAW